MSEAAALPAQARGLTPLRPLCARSKNAVKARKQKILAIRKVDEDDIKRTTQQRKQVRRRLRCWPGCRC